MNKIVYEKKIPECNTIAYRTENKASSENTCHENRIRNSQRIRKLTKR